MINPNVIHESAQHGRPISIRRSITLIVIGAGIGIVGIEAINAIRSRDISPKKAIGYVQGVPAHVQVASVDHAVSGNVHVSVADVPFVAHVVPVDQVVDVNGVAASHAAEVNDVVAVSAPVVVEHVVEVNQVVAVNCDAHGVSVASNAVNNGVQTVFGVLVPVVPEVTG